MTVAKATSAESIEEMLRPMTTLSIIAAGNPMAAMSVFTSDLPITPWFRGISQTCAYA
jgi:hypothetical protein